jgi:hypothetical protein
MSFHSRTQHLDMQNLNGCAITCSLDNILSGSHSTLCLIYDITLTSHYPLHSPCAGRLHLRQGLLHLTGHWA